MDKRTVISALLGSINDEIVIHEYGDGLLVDLPLTFSDGDSVRLLVEPMGGGVRVSDQASACERLVMADVNPDSGRVAEAIAATVRAARLPQVGGEADELAAFGPLEDLGVMLHSVAQAAMRVERGFGTVASVLARMQGVLATLERGAGCGDPGVMLAELDEWAPGRARANAVITFEAPRK